MKRFYILALLILALASCTQGSLPIGDGTDDEVQIDVPEYGYILFNSDVTSRGALYENGVSNGAAPDDNRFYGNFNVIGYTYSADQWTTAEPQATPNVFNKNPMPVSWNGQLGAEALYTYDNTPNDGNSSNPYAHWIGKQRYAFFAYYPTTLTTNVNDSNNSNNEGNPYIIYELDRTNAANHVDIMTACAIEANYATRSVNFNMGHRLAALDVTANNHYAEGNTIAINKLTLTLKGLCYDKVHIPLNDRDEPNLVYPNGVASNRSATFTIINNSPTAIPRGVETNLTGGTIGKTMILIPQPQEVNVNGSPVILQISATVDYSRNGGTGTPQTKTIDFNRELKGGRRYHVQLNFLPGDINILIIESDEWADSANGRIDHEFE